MFIKKRNEFVGQNLFELKPFRNFEYEVQEDEKITLLIPKFRGKILGKYLQPIINKKFYKVKLDKLGSFVWTNCDGSTTVYEIAERFKQNFGDTVEKADERVAKFIQQMYHSDCLNLSR
jgi:hypothetical protein